SRVRTALLRARRLLSLVALPLSIIISSAALAAEDAPAGGADEQPQRPAIILAQKLILWRNTQASYTSVTWDEAVGRLRLLRSKGPVRPEFLFTNGCYADEQRHDQFRQKIFEIYGE